MGGGRKAEPGRIFSGSSTVKQESNYGRVVPASRAREELSDTTILSEAPGKEGLDLHRGLERKSQVGATL